MNSVAPSTCLRLAATCLLGASLSLMDAAPAHAAVEIDVQEVRNYAMELDPGSLEFTTDPDGNTVLFGLEGDGPDRACAIIHAAESGARQYTYRYEDMATQCLGVVPKRGGGFYIRGAATNDPQALVIGFTAFLDATGEQRWAVHDQVLVDAEPRPEGTGALLGRYVQPHPVLAYSEPFDRLLGFTVGDLQIGADLRQVTQAHVVNGTSGRLRVSGQTFGQSGVGYVVSAVNRASDGYFLFYIYSFGSQGAIFYTYNGDQNIKFFRPRGEDWSTRYVVPPMIYGPDENVYLLWTPGDGSETDTHLTVVDDVGDEVWSSSWPAQATIDGEAVDIGPARAIWVGAEHAILMYQTAEGNVLRVVETAGGRSLGFVPWDGLSPRPAISIVTDGDGHLRILGYDQGARRIHEYRLHITGTPDDEPPGSNNNNGPGNNGQGDDVGPGADTGEQPGPDDGPDDDRRRDDGGCSSTGTAPMPSGAALVLALLLGARVRARRG